MARWSIEVFIKEAKQYPGLGGKVTIARRSKKAGVATVVVTNRALSHLSIALDAFVNSTKSFDLVFGTKSNSFGYGPRWNGLRPVTAPLAIA